MGEDRPGAPEEPGEEGLGPAVERLRAADPQLFVPLRAVAEQRGLEVEQVLVQVSRGVSYAGPVPPPWMLAEYDDALPGTAERLLGMAEREQLWRLWTERFGQVFGLVVALAAFGLTGSVVTTAEGIAGAIVGSIVGGGALVALVAVFVMGRRPDRADR